MFNLFIDSNFNFGQSKETKIQNARNKVDKLATEMVNMKVGPSLTKNDKPDSDSKSNPPFLTKKNSQMVNEPEFKRNSSKSPMITKKKIDIAKEFTKRSNTDERLNLIVVGTGN